MEIDIKKIAKLSRLAIEPEREEKFQKDMQNIIEMVERLPEMGAGDLSPKVEDAMTLREDEIAPSLPREEVLKNAPQTAAGCVVVPKTVG
ncbi:MAG: Asp-tRNA(Asn)/Glu-tRNA(Gln) amidotransferase subunit GatC [Angelakisella sp.]|nr:Asp-tRNA(Asn)/Glu-tRNA(Gln) amidotransferase subunit GatC [Angelakisella sp.]MBS7324405.1 Asp-tRNA(Asn)/Glu-tRNA(Gln) amidotransferase subunit GatC [Angelakisella sp.]